MPVVVEQQQGDQLESPEGHWSPVAANNLSPAERSLYGSVGGTLRNADPLKAAAAGRAMRKGQRTIWEREAAEMGITDPAEVEKFVSKRLDARMKLMTARSIKVRKLKQAARLRAQADAVEALADEVDMPAEYTDGG